MEQRRPSANADAESRTANVAPARARLAHARERSNAGSGARRLPPPLGDGTGAGTTARRADSLDAVEILSHELRSPITTIHLGTKVLRDGERSISKPVRREVVEAVEKEAERLYRLVEDILAVARHEGHAVRLPVGPLLLQHWLRDAIAAQVDVTPSLQLRVAIPPDLPPVLADDGALVHVVRNLLANAVRHAPDGMPVEIVAWPADAGMVRLEILDRGPGIDPGEAHRLFEPFYRSASARATGSGAGLGLAAAQRLVEAMGGTIEAVARRGGGARFVVQLPVATVDEAADRPHHEVDAPREGRSRAGDRATR